MLLESWIATLRPVRVLFLASDDLVTRVRLFPMLEILSRAGLVRCVSVDRDMRASGDRAGTFDVCLAHRNPGKRQIAWLRGRDIPLVYDIDDLLLSGDTRDAVRCCLEQASVVTAPSLRLLAALDAAMGGAMAQKAVFLPNAGREQALSTPPNGKPSLIWISSAIPRSVDGLMDVSRGIADAAARMRADLLLVGRFPPSIVAASTRVQCIPWIEPRALLDFLAARPLIAVAPLSTDLDEDDQLFVDCKSDIKIAQFGSSGIAGVYSDAVPYSQSDLPRRLALRNDAPSWTAEILDAAAAFPQEGVALAHHPSFAARRPGVLSQVLFGQLERAAASGRPFAFNALATPRFARIVEQRVRAWLR